MITDRMLKMFKKQGKRSSELIQLVTRATALFIFALHWMAIRRRARAA
jgi:hypothetical protein